MVEELVVGKEDEDDEEEEEEEEGEGAGEGGKAEFQCNKCDKSFKRRVAREKVCAE